VTRNNVRHRRQGPVGRLGHRILTAEARGDWDLYARLGDIVTGGAPGDSLEAIRWIAAHDGGVLDEAIRQHLWRHPEMLVAAVKAMRAWAANPHVSEATRREAEPRSLSTDSMTPRWCMRTARCESDRWISTSEPALIIRR